MANHPRKPDWNPRADEVLKDQIRTYDIMRAECPVAWSDFQHWTLFRHDDVMGALEDHQSFCFANIQCAFVKWPDSLHEPLREWVLKNHQAGPNAPRDVTTALMEETVNGCRMTDEELTSLSERCSRPVVSVICR